MRLATLRVPGGTRAVRVDGERYVDLGAPDVGAFLGRPDWQAVAAAVHDELADPGPFALLLPRPSKIVCVGLNYRAHIQEMGRPLPTHPTLFAKYAEALVGPTDPIARPGETEAMDWEAELGVVIGARVRRADEEQAAAAIAGFTVVNDITMRDWQRRTNEWLQGKTFEGTTPVGPVLVTPDELPGGVRPTLELSCSVDGVPMQKADTSDLVFDPVALVRYVSTVLTLNPGDLIATGTPGGVGDGRDPKVRLTVGQEVVTAIGGIGELRNRVVAG